MIVFKLPCWSVFVLGLISFSIPHNNGLTEAQKKGKAIYTKGEGSNGNEIVAMMSGFEVPASILHCSSCHGLEGEGKPEGGVNPSTLVWEKLTSKNEGVRPSGRRHKAYDEIGVKNAITLGMDPSGNLLNSAMPKYNMSQEDLSNLIAYLKIIGKEKDEGITDDKVTIGIALPANERLGEWSNVISDAVNAVASEVNLNDGIYGRKIELVEWHIPAEDNQVGSSFRSFLEANKCFAFTSSYLSNHEAEIASVAAELFVPMISSFADFPVNEYIQNRHVYFLDEGLPGQVKNLVNVVEQKHFLSEVSMIILVDNDTERKALSEIVLKEAKRKSWHNIKVESLPSNDSDRQAFISQLKKQNVEVVFYLDEMNFQTDFVKEAGLMDWSPLILCLGTISNLQWDIGFLEFEGEIILSYPTSKEAVSKGGILFYESLAKTYGLSPRYRQSQYAALSGSLLLLDALKRCGRELSKEKLLAALEATRDFESGLTQPLTFGPNTRVGGKKSFSFSFDPATGSIEKWQEK